MGLPASDPESRRRVGYLPEGHRFPGYLTARQTLSIFGRMSGLDSAVIHRRAPELLERVRLSPWADVRVKKFSKGMTQRLGLASALIHDPLVLLLDEPTDGVDPVGRREIRTILQELKGRGVTVFLNSHLLSEVEQLCDRVAILQRGLLAREGTVADLTTQQNLYVLGLADGQAFPADELRTAGYVVRPAGAHWEIALRDGQSIDPVVDLLRTRGLGLRHLVEKRQTLEEAFLQTVDAAGPEAVPVLRPIVLSPAVDRP
jgi:ABC-2 type transport system ATP-binding protein